MEKDTSKFSLKVLWTVKNTTFPLIFELKLEKLNLTDSLKSYAAQKNLSILAELRNSLLMLIINLAIVI